MRLHPVTVRRSRGSELATALLTSLALATAMLPATSAYAVTVDGPLDGDPEDTSVDIVGDNGRDQVLVRLIGADTLAVTDERGVDAEGDCHQAGPAEARCELYGTASPFVSLRGGGDFLRLDNSLTEYRYDMSCYALMGPGNDLFRGVPVTGFLPVDVEGGRGRDSLFGGGSGYVSLDGDQGADRLVGGRGNDLLYGGVGDDLLLGRAGRDDLFGGPGFDTARGGRGHDSYRRIERILSR